MTAEAIPRDVTLKTLPDKMRLECDRTMTLHVTLSPEAETRLRERAAEAGVQPDELARRIVESQVRRPTREEISGPIYKRFLESGSSEDELIEELEQAKHQMRDERHTRHSS